MYKLSQQQMFKCLIVLFQKFILSYWCSVCMASDMTLCYKTKLLYSNCLYVYKCYVSSVQPFSFNIKIFCYVV